MGGPIAHGVAQGLKKRKDPGGPPPPRWRLWLLVAGNVVLLAALALAWRYC